MVYPSFQPPYLFVIGAKNLPERAVHVVDVHARKLARELRWREGFKLLEKLIRWLVLPTVACRIDEEAKRLVPETTGNLYVRGCLVG